MVQLVILAHEVSTLKGKPDQYTGFPTGVNMVGGGWKGGGGGGGGPSKFKGEGGLSQYMGACGGGFPEKGKYLANICTVASKLKNVIFLLNKTLSNNIKVTAIFPTID